VVRLPQAEGDLAREIVIASDPDCFGALPPMTDTYLRGQVLIEGCAIQLAGLAMLALTIATVRAPSALLLSLVLAIFGFGLPPHRLRAPQASQQSARYFLRPSRQVQRNARYWWLSSCSRSGF
jgi:hypothetical protein